jgi:hypothetical protein
MKLSCILIKVDGVRTERGGSQDLVYGAAAQYNVSAVRQSEGANGGRAEELSERTWISEAPNPSRAPDILLKYHKKLTKDLQAPLSNAA